MVQHDGGLGGEDGMVLQQGRPQGAQQGPVRESVGCHMCSSVCVLWGSMCGGWEERVA